MRSTWPIYHPVTGKCVKRNSTKDLNCFNQGGQWTCLSQDQQLGLESCKTKNNQKWKYRGKRNKNIRDTNSNFWQLKREFGLGGPILAGQFDNIPSQAKSKYFPSGTNKFIIKSGKNPGQSHLKVNNVYVINNTNKGDNIKLVADQNINTKSSRLNFESPIFKRDRDILFNRWYTDPNLKSWKSETKKAFNHLLGKDQDMQRECCKRGSKYHQDLCANYWGPSSTCEGLLNSSEKTNCCRGIGNQHACGKYWGPTHKGDCNNTLMSYCATDSGLEDPKCGCLWPPSQYDSNVYKAGGPSLDSRCNTNGYIYTGTYPKESDDIVDNNCKIIFDRIENGETIKYTDQATLNSACSRYLAEKATKEAEEQALIRQLKAEEEARKQETMNVVNQISQINENINQLISKISQDRASISQLVLGLETTSAIDALDKSTQASNQASQALNAVQEALDVAKQAAVEADPTNSQPALDTAEKALDKAEQAVILSDQALQDANNAKNAADQAVLEAQKAQDLKLEQQQKTADLLAKQQAEQQTLLQKQKEEEASLLAQQEAQKQALEKELKQQQEELVKKLEQEQAPPEVIQQEVQKSKQKIQEEISKLEQTQEEEKKQIEIQHQEEQKQVTTKQEKELEDIGIKPKSGISTTMWAIIIVVALVILGVISAVVVLLFLKK